MKKILFVCPYPFNEAPSQRFRFEQYFSILSEKGFNYKVAPFYSEKTWKILYEEGQKASKAFRILLAFLQRMLLLFKLGPYQFVFIHREATPIGPPFFEWIATFIFKKRVIYDFDDAIWLEDPNEKDSLKAKIKWKSKVNKICTWSYKVSCGNAYLADFAKKYNENVVINPTTIDTAYHREMNVKRLNSKVTIGWTGTHSTLPYLRLILPVLDDLSQQHNFDLLVISNQIPDFKRQYLRFIKWSKTTEIEDLNKIDIGIMPLTDDIWSQGKCGFKLLQYMAVKKPTVASPVGVNVKLMMESQAGYTAISEVEWSDNLSKLINNMELRAALGNKGQQYVQNHYSVSSNTSTFLSLIE